MASPAAGPDVITTGCGAPAVDPPERPGRGSWTTGSLGPSSETSFLPCCTTRFGGTRGRMAPKKSERTQLKRAVRQLRRIRSFYAAATVLWAGSAALTSWQAAGSRQLTVCVTLLAVFAALFVMASIALRRLGASATTGRVQRHTTPPAVLNAGGHAAA